MHRLGFAATVPDGHVAVLLPRSGSGCKYGLELNNTSGIIDADYTGEWMASLRTKTGLKFSWEAGARIIQFIIVPITTPQLELVRALTASQRGSGGFGSTGQ
jgi:dUTP pyrophosphatase